MQVQPSVCVRDGDRGLKQRRKQRKRPKSDRDRETEIERPREKAKGERETHEQKRVGNKTGAKASEARARSGKQMKPEEHHENDEQKAPCISHSFAACLACSPLYLYLASSIFLPLSVCFERYDSLSLHLSVSLALFSFAFLFIYLPLSSPFPLPPLTYRSAATVAPHPPDQHRTRMHTSSPHFFPLFFGGWLLHMTPHITFKPRTLCLRCF